MHRRFIEAEHNGSRYADRIVVPESYRNEVLRVAHTIPLSGHMGFSKTLDHIGAHFSWPGLSSNVRKFCATCPQCQLVARKLKSHRVPLRPVEVVTEPFKKIPINILGELLVISISLPLWTTPHDIQKPYPCVQQVRKKLRTP